MTHARDEDRRPDDDEIIPIEDALARQVSAVQDAGATVAALILEAVRADVADNGQLSTLLPRQVRFGDLVGLRIMATVHRLALDRRAPAVALHLPTLGGRPPTSAGEEPFAAAVVAALTEHREDLARGMASAPQTNEPGRSAVLRAALSRLEPDVPVILNEIGASAGLNLRADHLPGVPALESGALPVIVERRGCDLHPIDPSTPDGRLTLTSYVWVDDVERFERLRLALEVAVRVPAPVVAQDAADFVQGLRLRRSATTVLWHSAMWFYLPAATKRRIRADLQALGSAAGHDAQLVHLSWEWAPGPDDPARPFDLVMRRWRGRTDDGAPICLLRGHSHGGRLVDCGDIRLPVDPLTS